MVSAALEVLEDECAHRHIQWSIDALGSAWCDRQSVKWVFENLLSNALGHTRHRDRARIQAGQRTLNEGTALFVADNGIGFDRKDARAPFGRDVEGTETGLATAERIIRQHGGRIWAEATPGVGATFCFTLGPAPDAL